LSRRRSVSRSPSVILDRYSPSPPSANRRGKRGRSETPPRKKQKLSKKGAATKVGKKSTLSKKSKNKRTKRAGNVEDDVIVEKTVTKRKKKNRRLNVVGGTSYVDDDDLSLINTHVSSEIADKEVFASGDKIMVSVNFRSSTNNRNSSEGGKRGKNKNVGMQTSSHSLAAAAANAKPMCVIDVMQSPYRIIEDSPKEIFDVFSDEENDSRKKNAPTSNTNSSNANASSQLQPQQWWWCRCQPCQGWRQWCAVCW